MNAIDLPPGNGDLGIVNARIISTKNTSNSVLIKRMELRDGLFQMPPLGTSRPDNDGIDVIRQWIQGLSQTVIVPALQLLLLDD
jgi:hypothetical protein